MMPTGTAPDRLTFCTLGPAATIVCLQDRQHRRHVPQSRFDAVMTSLMFLVPLSAASMFDWMLRSQIPVRFDGAWTSAPGSGRRWTARRRRGAGGCGGRHVGGHPRWLQRRLQRRQPYREASSVARFPPLVPTDDRVHPVVIHASRYSDTGSSACTVAAIRRCATDRRPCWPQPPRSGRLSPPR